MRTPTSPTDASGNDLSGNDLSGTGSPGTGPAGTAPAGTASPGTGSPGTGPAGFSLTELMVVILIIGLMAAIVFPRIDFISPRRTLTTAANLVLAAVAEARAESRLKRLDVELVYDFAAGTLSVREPDISAPVAPYGPAPEPVVLLTTKLPEGVTISRVYQGVNYTGTSGVTVATFKPSGSVGEHMVVLENANKDTISIFVPALSGAAFVVEGELSYAEVRSSRRLI